MRNTLCFRRAFTLIELLVVIAVIAILVALLVPAVQRVRYVAARTQSTNNLKQCALASHAYHDAWKYLPFNGVASATNTDNTSGSWAYQIFPYIDQQPLYDSQPADSSMGDPVPTLLCAIRDRPGYYTGTTSISVTGTVRQYALTLIPPAGNYQVGALVNTTPFTADPSFTYNWAGNYEWIVTVNGPATFTIANMTATFPGSPH